MDAPIQLSLPDHVMIAISGRLRDTRLRLGWKQSTLAQRSGVSLPTVRRYESTGQTSVANFLNLCFALGLINEVAALFQQPEAQSIADLEAMAVAKSKRKQRGTK
jgi:transcriptional regulator with XRE-family HTH domain